MIFSTTIPIPPWRKLRATTPQLRGRSEYQKPWVSEIGGSGEARMGVWAKMNGHPEFWEFAKELFAGKI